MIKTLCASIKLSKKKNLARWWWHTPFNSSTQETGPRGISGFKASLISGASSRTARVTQKNPISEKYICKGKPKEKIHLN